MSAKFRREKGVMSRSRQSRFPSKSARSIRPTDYGFLNLDQIRDPNVAEQVQILQNHQAMLRDLNNGWRPKESPGTENPDDVFSSKAELEKLTSKVHDKAMMDIDNQLKSLKSRINSNKELLDMTIRNIEKLTFSDDRNKAKSITRNKHINYDMGDIFDVANSKQWDKRLEELSKEIGTIKDQLKSDSFETKVSTGIQKFHEVLTKTLGTISKISGNDEHSKVSFIVPETVFTDDSDNERFYQLKENLETLEECQTPERDTM